MKECSDFYIFSFFQRYPFELNTYFNFVTMREFKVCLSTGLRICLGYKSSKKRSILTKLGYVFAVSNFKLPTNICDLMLDTFLQGHINILNISFIYALLVISLCNNTNVITKTSSNTGFNNDLEL